MKFPLALLVIMLAAMLPALGQEIPNPSFEEPEIDPSLEFLTPGSPGFVRAAASSGWSFGRHTGICVEEAYHAEGVSAADGHQVAFIQGERDSNDVTAGPQNIFGADIHGLEPDKEYELSWKQPGRASDKGTGAVRVVIAKEVDARGVVLLDKEPVATKVEWELKSVWFTATEPTMRLNISHFIYEAGNPPEYTETTLFDDLKIRDANSED